MSTNIGWIFLFLAGFSEIGFVVFLKLSNGFSKLYPSLGFIMFVIFSFTFLTQSIKVIPLGTAYAIWCKSACNTAPVKSLLNKKIGI